MARHAAAPKGGEGRDGREYDWLDDPFDERRDKQRMGGGSKAAIGVGCVVAFVLIIALVVIAVSGMADVAASM